MKESEELVRENQILFPSLYKKEKRKTISPFQVLLLMEEEKKRKEKTLWKRMINVCAIE